MHTCMHVRMYIRTYSLLLQVELFVSLGNGQSGHVTIMGDGVQAVPVGERGEVEVSKQHFPVSQKESDVPTQRQVHLSDEVGR